MRKLSAKRQQVLDLIPSRTKGDGGRTSGWALEDLERFVRELNIGTVNVILKAAAVGDTSLVNHLLCEPEFIEKKLIDFVMGQQLLDEYNAQNAQFKFMRD